ncbi:DUF5753 domain-containing protein [Micromonospora sp. NPDC049559]|uniref:DUF5753 domain-containing protein n=1 Tax=Micromonospora sp. NPDC049559 TaxID=3155923 RepID=UPI0034402579
MRYVPLFPLIDVREAMVETGQTAESLAAQIGMTPKTAARWVTPGRVPQSRHRADVARLLKREVVDLWPDILKRPEPAWFRPWTDIEREAVALRSFQLAWVPGLLQTEAYARATLAGEALTEDEVEQFVAARIDRHQILRRERPPLFTAVVDEGILRASVYGDRDLMREQCDYLVECAQLPAVRLHVVPSTVGMYPGWGGPFTIAELPGGERVAHVDSQAQAQIIQQIGDVATLDRRWERIRAEALSQAQSLDLLREAARSWT